jgi:hypothetical protein
LSPKVVHWHMSGNKREQEMSWTLDCFTTNGTGRC